MTLRETGCYPDVPEHRLRMVVIVAGPAHTRPQNTRSGVVAMAGRPGSVVVVVETAGDDGDHVGLDVVHKPVLLSYPA
jgi:2',3'-cyclic-nucleotide 2'-phosphodiesterase (5'-nucleotidase family)